MADDVTTQTVVTATVPDATKIATDQAAGGEHYQKMKLADGTPDSTAMIPGDAANGLDVDVTRVQGVVHVDDNASSLSVDDGGGSLTVDGTVGVNNFPAVQPVSDNAGSLTVDAPVGTPVWVRLSDGSAAFVGQKAMASSLPVVVASDQSAIPVSGGANVFHVDDNAGSLTVDGTVTANQGNANATPWNENLAQVGGVAIATKAGGTFGQTAIPVWPNAVQRDTYAALALRISSGALVANTRKDILSIEHGAGATKTVRIRRILVSAVITTAGAAVGAIDVAMYTGTAASSAGTAFTAIKHNQASAAAEATIKTLPTITANGGPVRIMGTWAPAAQGVLWSQAVMYDWQENGETVPLTLRSGTLESLVFAVQAVSTPTVLFNVDIIFTEE